MDEDKEFVRAKDYAYRLLSYRQRSTKEIKDRLEKKGFTSRTIKKTIAYLSELNYLNDESFAKLWVQTKMQLKPVGYSLLRYQLRQKGVNDELLEKVLKDAACQYNEMDAAKRLVDSRRSCYKGHQPPKLKRRLYGYLRRRGFSQEAILQAIEKYS